MLSKNIHNFIACDAEYEDADIVLFGAGFDGTTSFRPGTRFGPSAIRNESFGIETYSPYQDKDMLDYFYFDSGDLELAKLSYGQIDCKTSISTICFVLPYILCQRKNNDNQKAPHTLRCSACQKSPV